MMDLETKKQELLKQIEDIQEQIDARSKISPVFSGDFGDSPHNNSQYKALDRWQKARVRIIEKINIANNGDNGFKAGGANYCIYLECVQGNPNPTLFCCDRDSRQDADPMLYIRTWKAAQELLDDPEFCEDMRTYFKGWL